MNKRSNQLLAGILVVAIAFVSLLIRSAKEKLPAELPPASERAPAPHSPGQPPKAPDGQPSPTEVDPSIHLLVGNPSNAVAETRDPDNYLMRKPYFALSYNRTRGTPNWVSWCLQRSDFGPGTRVEFYPDSTLPQAFRRIVPRDYTNSGFDRGTCAPGPTGRQPRRWRGPRSR